MLKKFFFFCETVCQTLVVSNRVPHFSRCWASSFFCWYDFLIFISLNVPTRVRNVRTEMNRWGNCKRRRWLARAETDCADVEARAMKSPIPVRKTASDQRSRNCYRSVEKCSQKKCTWEEAVNVFDFPFQWLLRVAEKSHSNLDRIFVVVKQVETSRRHLKRKWYDYCELPSRDTFLR